MRLKNVAAYARLVSDLVHFRKLATERNTQTRRRPRALRMKDVLKAMDRLPIDVNNPLLPPKHRERWLKYIEALNPRSAYHLAPPNLPPYGVLILLRSSRDTLGTLKW